MNSEVCRSVVKKTTQALCFKILAKLQIRYILVNLFLFRILNNYF